MTRSGLIRLQEVRRADVLDDQKNASQVAAASTLSEDQEQFQEYILSQLKRIIFGNAAGTWNADFLADGVLPLAQLAPGAGQPLVQRLLYYIDQGPVDGHIGAFKEIVGSPWPSSVTWYTDATKTKKIVEKVIVRNAEQAPTQITWRLYDADGVTVAAQAVDTIVNVASFESTRTRVIT